MCLYFKLIHDIILDNTDWLLIGKDENITTFPLLSTSGPNFSYFFSYYFYCNINSHSYWELVLHLNLPSGSHQLFYHDFSISELFWFF